MVITERPVLWPLPRVNSMAFIWLGKCSPALPNEAYTVYICTNPYKQRLVTCSFWLKKINWCIVLKNYICASNITECKTINAFHTHSCFYRSSIEKIPHLRSASNNQVHYSCVRVFAAASHSAQVQNRIFIHVYFNFPAKLLPTQHVFLIQGNACDEALS